MRPIQSPVRLQPSRLDPESPDAPSLQRIFPQWQVQPRPTRKLQSIVMDPSISRFKLRLVWAGYAMVAAFSALLVFVRYLKYVENPQDAAAAGGMWAGGDLALELIILFLFLVPTAALVLVIRKSDAASTQCTRRFSRAQRNGSRFGRPAGRPLFQSMAMGRSSPLSPVCNSHHDLRPACEPFAHPLRARTPPHRLRPAD